MSDLAPNWDQGQGLTWPGKWHIFEELPQFSTRGRTHCGAYAYTKGQVPNYVGRLQAISKGYKAAPVCKKCERYLREGDE